jgi:hypothetical protein
MSKGDAMPASWIEYKEKKILYVDFRDIKDQKKLVETLYDGEKLLRASVLKVPILADYRSAIVGREFMGAVKKLGKEVIKDKSKKLAILGVTDIKKLLLQGYNRFTGDNLIPFNDEISAKEYLIKED